MGIGGSHVEEEDDNQSDEVATSVRKKPESSRGHKVMVPRSTFVKHSSLSSNGGGGGKGHHHKMAPIESSHHKNVIMGEATGGTKNPHKNGALHLFYSILCLLDTMVYDDY